MEGLLWDFLNKAMAGLADEIGPVVVLAIVMWLSLKQSGKIAGHTTQAVSQAVNAGTKRAADAVQVTQHEVSRAVREAVVGVMREVKVVTESMREQMSVLVNHLDQLRATITVLNATLVDHKVELARHDERISVVDEKLASLEQRLDQVRNS